jgi:hypothetical protein
MVVDANLGVNKANYHLTRSFKLNSSIVENKLKRNLVVTLENDVNPSITPNEIYKTYLRILVPKESYVNPINLVYKDKTLLREPEEFERSDLKEVGVWIEIPSGESVDVKYTWASDLTDDKPTSYNMLWYKQAGTLDDTLNMTFTAPKPIIAFNELSSLTFDTLYMYNSPLKKDINFIINW